MSKEVKIELIVDSSEAQKNIDEVNQGLQQTDEKLKQTNKSAKKGKKGFTGLTTGARALGTALKAAGIGLVIAALTALGSALSNNQKVLNTFNLVIGTATQFMTDLVSSIIDALESQGDFASQFDAIGKIITAWGKGVIAVYSNVFNTLKAGILGAQLAWEKSFFGDGDETRIKELQEGIDAATTQIGENISTIGNSIVTIGSNVGEAISEIANVADVSVKAMGKVSLKNSFENTKLLQELTRNAEIARVTNQGLIEQYDRQAEQQRQIRDDDTKNIDDRIAANEKLKEKLEEQKNKMIENAQLMVRQAQLQFDLTGKEADNIKLLEAKNEKKAIEAQIEGFMSEQKSNALSLDKERTELQLSNAEAEAERQKAERDFNAEMEEDEVRRIQMMISNLEIEKQIDQERLQSKIDGFTEGTQAQQDAQNELDTFLAESGRKEKKLKADLIKFTDAADKKSADNTKKLQLQKVADIKGALSNIASIVGANSKFGKAIAIAQAIQDTYAGADKALAQGGIFGFIGAAAVIAGGIANVKKITSTKTPKPPASLGARSTGGESTPAITAPSTPSLPPEFSTVGTSGTNQIAELLGNQPPPRAFVVSGDVSTAQQLDRNIVTSASLG